MYVSIYLYMYMYRYIRTYVHTYLRTYKHTCIHAYITFHIITLHYITLHYITLITYITHKHVFIYIYTCIFTHIYIYTYMYVYTYVTSFCSPYLVGDVGEVPAVWIFFHDEKSWFHRSVRTAQKIRKFSWNSYPTSWDEARQLVKMGNCACTTASEAIHMGKCTSISPDLSFVFFFKWSRHFSRVPAACRRP